MTCFLVQVEILVIKISGRMRPTYNYSRKFLEKYFYINIKMFIIYIKVLIKKEAIYLHFHWIGIHLTHILSTIFSTYISYVQSPCIIIIMCHRQTSIICNNVLVNGQYCFCISFYPCNLN